MEDIKNPKRYTGKNGMQALDVIDEFNLDFWRGNALKYIIRCEEKGGAADIDKAIVYLEDYKSRFFDNNFKIEKSEEINLNKPYIWKDETTKHDQCLVANINSETITLLSYFEEAKHLSVNEFINTNMSGFIEHNWLLIDPKTLMSVKRIVNHD